MPPRLKPGLTLYFCRHGQTEANVQGRLQGHTKDTALTAKGASQARAIADIFKRAVGDPGAFAYVSSPLARARRTLEVVRGELGLPRDGYTTDDRLTEINYGLWEGLTHAEARARDPAPYDARIADRWHVPVPGGENYFDVAARAQSWVVDVSTDTFAVSHGVFTRILRGLFEGLTWQQMSDLDEPQGVLFRVRGREVERYEAQAP